MAIYRKSGGTNVVPSAVRRRSGGAWANVQNIYRRSGGVWVLVWAAYRAISVSANSVSGNVPPRKGTATLGTSTVTVSGGNGSYTYTCTRIAGNGMAVASGTGASRTFSYTNPMAATIEPGSETWRWTVSDGVTSAYCDFTVSYY